MKKKLLPLAVAAGLVGGAVSAAQAEMHINPRGLGEALIYPFYSAAGGNDTLVNIVNTTGVTKAVKVRFIEAMNSQEVLDFNLYLSPEDVWTGVITANPRGEGAIIRTADNSCTVPAIGSPAAPGYSQFDGWADDDKEWKNQPFVNYKYGVEGLDPYLPDTLPEADRMLTPDAEPFRGLDRTLEGYIEVIEMGQLDPEDESYGEAAVHDEDGVPNNCGLLVKAWTNSSASDTGAWLTNPQKDLLPWGGEDSSSAGGLYGYGVIINVPEGTATSYDAVAIDGFNSPVIPTALHFQPGFETPSLSNANELATIFDGTAAITTQFATSADAVSALFMSSSIANDYVTDASIGALTDWVVTMPTKRFYVASNPATTPFTDHWKTSEETATRPASAGACEVIGYEYWDREEAFVPVEETEAPPIFSPLPPQIPAELADDLVLCTEVTVISFGAESALNASENINYGLPTGDYTAGWARIHFDNLSARELSSIDGVTLTGLPVIGFATFDYQHGNLNGVLSNYGASATHKSEVDISTLD